MDKYVLTTLFMMDKVIRNRVEQIVFCINKYVFIDDPQVSRGRRKLVRYAGMEMKES